MENEEVNNSRRRFLILSTSAAGGVAIVGAAVPFVASWFPSERAKALGAPVELDASKIEEGGLVTVAWQGKPVWVLKRSAQQVEALGQIEGDLLDPGCEVANQPEYCKNQTRSIKPELLVCVGVCTHLGCSPTYRPDVAPADLGPDWKGGFFCPCHGSKFDLAGRVYKGVPAPTNLVIPPYKFLSDTVVLIGEE